MDKWEYCWLRGFDPFSDKGMVQINELGLAGWEAVNFAVALGFGYTAMFKRKIA